MGAILDMFGSIFGALNQHQRERIEDAERLLENRERERDEARAEVEKLKGEVKTLRARLAQCEPQQPETLPAEAVKILRFLVQQNESTLKIETIARACLLETPKAQYHIDGLARRQFIYTHLNMIRPTEYSASTKGRAYLFEVVDGAANAQG